MSYTPGPWYAHQEETIVRWGYVSNTKERDTKLFIASCFDVPDVTPDANTSEANARLIAAAPELLDALKGAEIALMNCIPVIPYKGDGPLVAIRAVIAKATGGAT